MSDRTDARHVIHDPALRATVVARTPLYYAEGADEALDRPAHVRSGSGLAWVPGGLAVVQDDANFLAVVAPDGAVRAVTLPAGEGGRRQFDDGRGTKRFKLDLEACFTTTVDGRALFVAFGSGATPPRERVVLVDGWEAGAPRVTVVHAAALYATLRSARAFAGSELNVEGAALVGDRVRLFNRGNGAPRDGVAPVNATADLAWPALLAWLRAPDAGAPPPLTDVVPYALGAAGGVRLTFTDAVSWGDRVLFLAAAEDSPDAVQDGPVAGAAVGVIEPDGSARWAPLLMPDGAPFTGKAEGLAVEPGGRSLRVVVDADDPAVASELCRVELAGAWRAERGEC